MTTDELIPFYEGRSIAKVASELGKSAINLDGDLQGVDWQKKLYIDFEKYAKYKNKYVKIDGSPDIPLWNIVINHIEKTESWMSADLPGQCASASGGGVS